MSPFGILALLGTLLGAKVALRLSKVAAPNLCRRGSCARGSDVRFSQLALNPPSLTMSKCSSRPCCLANEKSPPPDRVGFCRLPIVREDELEAAALRRATTNNSATIRLEEYAVFSLSFGIRDHLGFLVV
jgi:hypothetical protein